MGKKVVYMPSCHSTNEVASQMLKSSGVMEGTIIITDNQTAGRGQQGNTWEADPGKNLTFSLILSPKGLPLANHFMLNVIVSLGITDYLSSLGQTGISIKWPNDIYHHNDKLGGILIQNTVKRQVIEHSIIGIGLNVNQREFATPRATSISLLTKTDGHLSEILDNVVHGIETRYMQFKVGKLDQLNKGYLDLMMWKDEVHTFEDSSGFFTGIIRGVNHSGQLEIECEDNTRYFDFREVSYIK